MTKRALEEKAARQADLRWMVEKLQGVPELEWLYRMPVLRDWLFAQLLVTGRVRRSGGLVLLPSTLDALYASFSETYKTAFDNAGKFWKGLAKSPPSKGGGR